VRLDAQVIRHHRVGMMQYTRKAFTWTASADIVHALLRSQIKSTKKRIELRVFLITSHRNNVYIIYTTLNIAAAFTPYPT
jgi:hypothetical protein